MGISKGTDGDVLMGKSPSFQFYPGDWLRDTQVQMASLATKGFWFEMLIRMWDAPERGKIKGTIEQLSRLVYSSNGDVTHAIDEIIALNIADVTKCNDEIIIINRRMFREQKERENTRLRVSRLRDKKKCNANVTPPSSSSSSSIINNNKDVTCNGTKKFYYRDNQGCYVCKNCQRIFSKYQNFKSHKCGEQLMVKT
jgi:hypothetical protein